MFKNYFIIAFRNLVKRKGFTLINILGLATGMAVCLLIVLFIHSELGYDNFETKGDRVYRVVLERKYPERSTAYSIIPLSVGKAIAKEFPEVECATLLADFSGADNFNVRVGDRIFEEKRVFSADSNFCRVFTPQLIEGDTANALVKPNMAIISERTAKKMFGSAAAAIGKTFETDFKLNFVVSGVCKDWPGNSHMDFNILLSSTSFPFQDQSNYTRFSNYAYLLLRPNASPAAL